MCLGIPVIFIVDNYITLRETFGCHLFMLTFTSILVSLVSDLNRSDSWNRPDEIWHVGSLIGVGYKSSSYI